MLGWAVRNQPRRAMGPRHRAGRAHRPAHLAGQVDRQRRGCPTSSRRRDVRASIKAFGHILSESFGESETALLQDGAEGAGLIAGYEAGAKRGRATRTSPSVLVSAGDDGSSATDINNNLIPTPSADYPASSPNVTTVGGTSLFFGTAGHADPNGTYKGEVVWNDPYGGGRRRHWQAVRDAHLTSLTPAVRFEAAPAAPARAAIPDIAYNAGVDHRRDRHLGSSTSASRAWQQRLLRVRRHQRRRAAVGGHHRRRQPARRSAARLPQHAPLQPWDALPASWSSLMHDITVGNNSDNGVAGYSATPSWDLATGMGHAQRRVHLLADRRAG